MVALSSNDPRRHRPGWVLIFCATVRHWRSGKIMKRKDGKPFAFWVRASRLHEASMQVNYAVVKHGTRVYPKTAP